MTHILVDTANTFFRARHVIRGDTSEKVGMAIHIMMNSIKKAWQDFDGPSSVSGMRAEEGDEGGGEEGAEPELKMLPERVA